MAQPKHAPEPWVVARDRNNQTGGEDDPLHGTEHEGTHPSVQGMRCPDFQYNRDHVQAEANAQRTVACVNAMAGIEDPEKLRTALNEVVSFYKDFGIEVPKKSAHLKKILLAAGLIKEEK